MLKHSNIDLSGNNSTQQPTAQPSEMGKYSTPELQAAFNSGREIGKNRRNAILHQARFRKYAKGS